MEKITVPVIKEKKRLKQPITALTCYDAASAAMIDPVVDIALVGDSLANTRLGYPNTLPVTLDEMLHHVRAASRGVRRALLVADMPYQSYETAPWQAAQAAGRFIKEAGAHAVKCEGGERIKASVAAMINANIPVMGHLGLAPQSVHHMGGYKVQARKPKDAKQLLAEAKLLEKIGIFALVLEGIPAPVANTITKALKIPTIGIGAGPYCDGQILVLDDVLGLTPHKTPKFVKRYANLMPLIQRAVRRYADEVVQRRFPTRDHSY